MSKKYSLIILSALLWLSFGCQAPKVQTDGSAHPAWSESSVIYEINVRQYTPEGTFAALSQHLPRLSELGVDILWLMPIYPIGELDRKEGLGSYYSIKDYQAINPEFGTEADFRDFLKQAKDLGFKVILDWVANHTSRDHQWIETHPSWYVLNDSGQVLAPFDWTDVAQLDWENDSVHQAMLEAMKYWVNHFDIDGFRCDVAGMVPIRFWEQARTDLSQIKPLFMLAEDDDHRVFLNKAFDANYGWTLHHHMNQIAQGKSTAKSLVDYLRRERQITPARGYRMTFTSNHDENSWNGTEFERMGDAYKLMATLSFTFPQSIPLIYSGQEAGLNKRLRFFTKDTIEWTSSEFTGFYKELIALKRDNVALHNGDFGGDYRILTNENDEQVLAIHRFKDQNEVVIIYNLSANVATAKINTSRLQGHYSQWQSDFQGAIPSEITLDPWQVIIYNK